MLNQVLGGVGGWRGGGCNQEKGISAGMKSMRSLCGSPAELLGNGQPEAREDPPVSRKGPALWEQSHTEAKTCCNTQIYVLYIRAGEPPFTGCYVCFQDKIQTSDSVDAQAQILQLKGNNM